MAAQAYDEAAQMPIPGDGESRDDSEPVSADGDPAWLPPVLRMMAETQRSLQERIVQVPQNRQRMISNVKLEEFHGGRTVSSYQYRQWKKSVEVARKLYDLSDSELALVIYTQVKGKAKQLLEVLELSEMVAPEGLSLIWNILDRAHEKMAHERADDAYQAWEGAHRRHGQSMDDWITYLQKCKLELEAQDSNLIVSEQQLASKMLRGANLPQEKRAQVLFNCGGVYDPKRMETVLRVTYPRIAEQERRQGIVMPRKRTEDRSGWHKSSGKPRLQTRPRRSTSRT